MRYTLKNDALTVAVDSHGAELRSIKDNRTGREYLFQADPVYWNRTSPVLFPFVGGTKEKTYYYNGVKYEARQHGFARDTEFTLVSQTETELWLQMRDSDETRANYPFAFTLGLGYRLTGNTLTVLWNVTNDGGETMHFSIGGHPAFRCDLNACGLRFEKEGKPASEIVSGVLEMNGSNCLSKNTKSFSLVNGVLPLSPALFDEDALILENRQADAVTLLDAAGRDVLTVAFDAPLFGVWSPTGKNAPFVCIEPWYGRCDSADFSQKLEEKAYSTALAPGEAFAAAYRVIIQDAPAEA